ncbi:MAG: beta-mannosidase [Oscillospiraceae bacterium]|nr:beta-mannosidase [Oscillospiraceae bacterium]
MKKSMTRGTSACLAAVTALLCCTGCSAGKPKYDITQYQDTTARKEFNTSLDFTKKTASAAGAPADFKWVGQAEDGKFTGKVSEVNVEFPGFVGNSYVGNFTSPEDTVIFTVEVPADGVYNLSFNTCVGFAETDKINPVIVDGTSVGSITSVMGKEFSESPLENVYLTAGTHEIAAGTEWGYYFVDQLTVTAGEPISDSVYEVTAALSDPDAFDNSKRLYKFLRDCYGRYTITGQYCDKGKFGTEMNLIHEETGEYPAILGLDMIDYTPSRVQYGGGTGKAVDYAKDFYLNSGGIVTMAWHWNAPDAYLINTGDHPWYSGFYAEHCTLDLDKIADGTDAAGKDALLADIKAIAEAMEPLREAQVPVLWRPLHEASGGWFWWGNCKKESYLWLWNLVYDQMVNVYGLHNLIWVWNGQDKEWYPGDKTVDIVGMDIYADKHAYASQSSTFSELTGWSSERKLIALSENGVMPDPELIQRDNAVWNWFATWSGEFVQEYTRATEAYTEFAMWDKVYQSEDTLTLDELPCLWDYPME